MSTNVNRLERFIKAQARDYDKALTEIKRGRKLTHWMWYIFPQIAGLGFSETSKLYAIKDINEAEDFLKHPILGAKLIEISSELLKLPTDDAHQIFGTPDDLKLKSSMTLFSFVDGTDLVFKKVLEKFFGGDKDLMTLKIIRSEAR